MTVPTPLKTGSTPLHYTLGIALFRLISLTLVGTIILLLLPFALKYVEGWEKYAWIKRVVATQAWVLDSAGAQIRKVVPTHIKGGDRTIWFVVGATALLQIFAGRATTRLINRSECAKIARGVADWKARMGLAQNAAVTRELNDKLSGLKDGGKEEPPGGGG